MTPDEALALFQRTGVAQEGHFLLASGMHSGRYLQCAQLLQYPDLAALACGVLAARFRDAAVEVVVGAALGGIIVAHEVGRALGTRAIFAERVEGAMTLRRGFAIRPGERVLVVEDVLTTGGSAREVVRLAQGAGGAVMGVAALVDRSGGRADVGGVPVEALLTLQVETYPPDACPLCRQGMPLTKPGTKVLQDRARGRSDNG
ncbi:MAG: orotate phosphoribosyltransferase [Armatimonadetes bacterium]|nr:orotate phosphoribosyltransferase [Armatimonadota bacterium]